MTVLETEDRIRAIPLGTKVHGHLAIGDNASFYGVLVKVDETAVWVRSEAGGLLEILWEDLLNEGLDGSPMARVCETRAKVNCGELPRGEMRAALRMLTQGWRA